MKITTSRFGTIEISEKDIIFMPYGMIGFSNDKEFILLKHAEGSPFLWFQSISNPSLAFVLIDPFLIEPNYEIQLSEEDKNDLQIEKSLDKIQTLIVLNISSNNGESFKVTANLLAPVVINIVKKLAKQVILFGSMYSHRHPVELKNRTSSSI
ncbi:MAG: flagellar assembly protein FliW [Bacteroidales bacterium]